MRAARSLLAVLGLVLAWLAAGVAGFDLSYSLRVHRQAVAYAKRATVGMRRAVRASGACAASLPPVGALAGVLRVPAISLVAPVAQGVTDQVLESAVGHVPQTVWPGQIGNSVLLAHDVSYFSQISQLRAGDLITFEGVPEGCRTAVFSVVSKEVIDAGVPLAQEMWPTLTLVTCWPTNALWYTPKRLAVTARFGGWRPFTQQGGLNGEGFLGRRLAEGSGPEVNLPPGLAAQDLSLAGNPTPMGVMTFAGDPTMSWLESPAPLSVEEKALELYFASLHSLREGRLDWWQAIAPGVQPPPVLLGYAGLTSLSPLDVTEGVNGASLYSVTLSRQVRVTGPGVPGGSGRFQMVVTEGIAGWRLVVTSFVVRVP
jgi:sortase A